MALMRLLGTKLSEWILPRHLVKGLPPLQGRAARTASSLVQESFTYSCPPVAKSRLHRPAAYSPYSSCNAKASLALVQGRNFSSGPPASENIPKVQESFTTYNCLTVAKSQLHHPAAYRPCSPSWNAQPGPALIQGRNFSSGPPASEIIPTMDSCKKGSDRRQAGSEKPYGSEAQNECASCASRLRDAATTIAWILTILGYLLLAQVCYNLAMLPKI